MRLTVLIVCFSLFFAGCAEFNARVERIKHEEPRAKPQDDWDAAVGEYMGAVTASAWRFSVSSDSAEDISDAALSASADRLPRCRTAAQVYMEARVSRNWVARGTNDIMANLIGNAKLHAKRVVIERRTMHAEVPPEPPPPPRPAAYDRA